MSPNELAAEAEKSFAEMDDRIAAEVRQLFRALHAEDTKAVEVCLYYFRYTVILVLGAHLKRDPRWESDKWWLEGFGAAAPDVQPPTRLRIRDELTRVTRDNEVWINEPFEFELELWPQTGEFRRCTFRFGDHRPLSEKGSGTSALDAWPAAGEWAFVIQRGDVQPDHLTS
jgi:hypothetical protein